MLWYKLLQVIKSVLLLWLLKRNLAVPVLCLYLLSLPPWHCTFSRRSRCGSSRCHWPSSTKLCSDPVSSLCPPPHLFSFSGVLGVAWKSVASHSPLSETWHVCKLLLSVKLSNQWLMIILKTCLRPDLSLCNLQNLSAAWKCGLKSCFGEKINWKLEKFSVEIYFYVG